MCEIESFFRNVRASDARVALQHQFAYWVCPVLGDIKPAVLFQVKGEELCRLWREMAGSMLRTAGIEERRLSVTPSRTAVLLYRAPSLAEWLARPDNRALLARFGYDPDAPLDELLARLEQRYDVSAYPHEIGVFLGYPSCDVEGFIRNRGQNYKDCGYWKVYGDVEQSRRVFRRIDSSRMRMARMLNNRVPVSRALLWYEYEYAGQQA